MSKYDNKMSKQGMDLPGCVEAMGELMWENACKYLVSSAFEGVERIFITGAGDSYAAGISMKSAFDTIFKGKVRVEPTRAINLSKVYSDARLYGDGKNLVIAISESGGVPRVVEVAKRAQKNNVRVLAITTNTGSALAENSDFILPVVLPQLDLVPNITSYVGSCIGIVYTALIMGALTGEISGERAVEMKNQFLDYMSNYESALAGLDTQMTAITDEWKDMNGFDFIADGPDYGTALFAAYKFGEASGDFTTFDDSENWQHVSNFVKDTHNTPLTMIIHKNSPSLSRQLECLKWAVQIERPLLIITDMDDFDDMKAHIVKMPTSDLPFAIAATEHLALDLLSAYLTTAYDEVLFRGRTGLWKDPENSVRIRHSKIEVI